MGVFEYKQILSEMMAATNRKGYKELLEHMENSGFFTAPCSGQKHLSREGGLAEHSFNVAQMALSLKEMFAPDVPRDSVIICAILHDLGKMGQYGKPNYVPNMLTPRATKANPNPEPYQSDKKPYVTNPDLMYVDHEIRSIVIAQQYIKLTEEEQTAILWHNGLYGPFKYEIPGKETPLYLLIHMADMWAARVIEKEDDQIESEE